MFAATSLRRFLLAAEWQTIGIVLAIGLLCGLGARAEKFARAENIYQEATFAFGDSSASGQIHLVEMDAASIAAIREWPWSREHYARAVEQLAKAGVRTVSFDVDFSSHSSIGGDAQFAAAIAAADVPVVMPTFTQATRFGGARSLDVVPIEQLRERATLGSVSIFPDADGFVRRMPIGTITQGTPRPSLAAHIAEQSGLAGESFPIDYAINPATIPRHSFVAIERGDFDALALRGKDVIIGATAIELGDRYAVPRYGVIPGVMIQAIAAETLLAGKPTYASWPLPLALAVLLALLVMRAPSHATAALRALSGIVIILFSAEIARNLLMLWFEIVPACLTLGVTLAARSAQLYQASYLARRRTDPATGLPNAAALHEDLASHSGGYVIAAMIDGFDALKVVLGPEGHGDFMRRLVERMEWCGCDGPIYRTDDRVFSWCTTREFLEIEELLVALRATMRRPLEIGGRRIDVTLHFGVARLPGAQAIGYAAHAANSALRSGEVWRLHEESQSARLELEVSLMSELDEALDNGQIYVVHQPKLHLASGAITCAEALVRWHHKQRGLLPPDSFIPLAEAMGRIEDLTLHVIQKTILDQQEWQRNGLEIGVAVNISAKLLTSASFIESTKALIARLDAATHMLTFEVTESAELGDRDAAILALESLRDLGITISMDDYGTGQSTLSYLRSLPIAELKIDRSFVQHAHVDRSDAMLVRSTVQLAHEMGVKVVAEGVEDSECLAFLREAGCDYAQGYFIGRPMSADALRQLLQEPARKVA